MRKALFSLAVVTALLGTTAASAETRVALVIGNGAYESKGRLPNPVNDADDVAAALKRANFEVILGKDLQQAAMQDATIRFARAASKADVAIFYYSGHAMQFGGVNYLMPIDAALEDEADLKRFVRVDDILSDLQQARNLRILVLDSCRDNPLAESLKRSGRTRAAYIGRGLNKIEAPLGTIVSFSTQSGKTADDGTGRNSPYTESFIKHIEQPKEIGEIFRDIGADVYEKSGKAQLPELSLSIVGKFYLNGPVSINIAQPPSSGSADPCAAAESHWKAADSIAAVSAYEDHVAKFPNCAFAALAKARIDQTKQKTALLAPGAAPARSDGGSRKFDGKWSVTISCTAAGKALGYNKTLLAVVKDGKFHAEDGVQGKPNFLAIDGDIEADGKAFLLAKGLSGKSQFTMNNAAEGSAYSYTINAQFDASGGSGKRNELRPCNLVFAKR